ncbi:MAG TPA: RHS repeat-associated core domain-containing protein, partial [Anseongella sp.]|nr:RHS repeat-associated core domain-containing protein [Anseongella sp.]
MLSTYYVYDDFGNLTYVLPPGRDEIFNPDAASLPSAVNLNAFCYQYRYDERNRLIEKKLPGKEREYIVYNKLDQVVATQDANQQLNKEWLITKYDGVGRVVMTGIWNNGNNAISRDQVQTLVNAQTGSNQWEERITTGTGYTNRSWPTNLVTTTLTLNYYDDYEIPGLPTDYNKKTQHSRMTYGLATASRTKVLNQGTGIANMLWSVSYYDDKGRVTRQFNQHYKGGGAVDLNNYDEIVNAYDFTGKVTESTRKHVISGSVALTVLTEHSYDHAGRLTDTWKQVNSATPTLIARNEYNEVSQLRRKLLHSTTGTTFAQDVTYSYNIRGWLQKSQAPLFTQELRYTEGSLKEYNGNIAYQLFTRKNAAGTNVTETYTYSYDHLNRLTSGTLSGSKGRESLVYDRMGNILSLDRSGTTSALVDDLTYNYAGNRISSIADANANASNVYQLPGSTTYTYDDNGNLKTKINSAHTQKNITGIIYNHLNLPQTITATAGNVTYTYDATGRKLRSINGASGQTRDYVDGIEYAGGTLELIRMEEGRIIKSGSSYEYDYVLKDHLGNSRVGFKQSSSPTTTPNFTADYYPFGLQYPADMRQPSPKNNYLY